MVYSSSNDSLWRIPMSLSVNGTSAATYLPRKASANSTEYNQNAYLKELNGKVKAPVTAGVWNGKTAFGGATPSVMINPAYLQQMHGDPALGAYIEEQINAFADTAASIMQQHAANGNTVTSMGMYIDENGGMSSYMQGTFTSPGGAGGITTTEKKNKTVKELMEELQEKREQEQEQQRQNGEKLEKKRHDEQMLLNSLKAGATVNVIQSETES